MQAAYVDVELVGYHLGEFLQYAVTVDPLDAYLGEEFLPDLLPAGAYDARPVGGLQHLCARACQRVEFHLPLIVDEAHYVVAGDRMAAVGHYVVAFGVGAAQCVGLLHVDLFGRHYGDFGLLRRTLYAE